MMAHANGIITAPINIETDIYAVLGIGPTSMGYDIGNACKSVKVNTSAKYKPIVYPQMPEINETQRKAAHYGFNVAEMVLSISNVKSKSIYYQAPAGGDASPFRSTDFDNYFHNATNIIKDITMPSSLNPFGDNIIDLGRVLMNTTNSRELDINQIIQNGLSTNQLAVAIFNSSSSVYYYRIIPINPTSQNNQLHLILMNNDLDWDLLTRNITVGLFLVSKPPTGNRLKWNRYVDANMKVYPILSMGRVNRPVYGVYTLSGTPYPSGFQYTIETATDVNISQTGTGLEYKFDVYDRAGTSVDNLIRNYQLYFETLDFVGNTSSYVQQLDGGHVSSLGNQRYRITANIVISSTGASSGDVAYLICYLEQNDTSNASVGHMFNMTVTKA